MIMMIMKTEKNQLSRKKKMITMLMANRPDEENNNYDNNKNRLGINKTLQVQKVETYARKTSKRRERKK